MMRFLCSPIGRIDGAYCLGAEIDMIRTGVVDQPSWILEGGPSVLTTHALSRADIVVWLDMPKGLRVRRIIWRSLQFMGQTRPEHPTGNPEWPGVRQMRFIGKAWAARRANTHDDLLKTSCSPCDPCDVRAGRQCVDLDGGSSHAAGQRAEPLQWHLFSPFCGFDPGCDQVILNIGPQYFKR